MKDYFGYQGKVVVITGAASGMGKAATEMLVDLGAEVYALDWAEVTTPGIKKYVKVNMGDKASIDEAMKQVPGQIDSFMGVAGVSGKNHDFNDTVTINFIGNKYITDEYLSKRVKNGGAISYVSSIGGSRWMKFMSEFQDIVEAKTWDEMVAATKGKGQTGMVHGGYCVAKRALCYYAKTIIAPFGKKNIRVNCVMPCLTTDTGLTQEFYDISGGESGAKQTMPGAANFDAGSKDMANALIFLNSAMNAYISGLDFYVDYGFEGMVLIGERADTCGVPLI